MNDGLTTITVEEAEGRAARADVRVRLAAEAAGLIDVAVATMESPLGELYLAVTGAGLACVAYDEQDRVQLERRFAAALSPRILASSRATDGVRRELDEYFAGSRRAFDLSLDLRLMSPFVRKVLGATALVPYGEISTYGALARQISRPTGARAVGAALGSNPIPIVIPCHRIVGASGRLTGYAGGLHRKEFLLRLEGDQTLPV